MANSIFISLFHKRVDQFRKVFYETSRTLFYDPEEKALRHPGEFGRYREKICKEFLRLFVPQRLEIDDGFVINSNDKVSHQCDLVIYDKGNTPLIQTSEHQMFYPIETVVGIGEVKSVLSFRLFKEALRKLSKLKKMREEAFGLEIIHPLSSAKKKYAPRKSPHHQIVTFLICEKLDFDWKNNLVDKFDEIYYKIDHLHRHNFILSIKDEVLILYSEKGEFSPCPYPVFEGEILKNLISYKEDDRNYPFEIFAQYLSDLIGSHAVLYPVIFSYLGTYDKNGTGILED